MNAFSKTVDKSITPFNDANIGNLEGILFIPHCPAMPVKTAVNSVVYPCEQKYNGTCREIDQHSKGE